jgi:hypothetical protein
MDSRMLLLKHIADARRQSLVQTRFPPPSLTAQEEEVLIKSIDDLRLTIDEVVPLSR